MKRHGVQQLVTLTQRLPGLLNWPLIQRCGELVRRALIIFEPMNPVGKHSTGHFVGILILPEI
jgi:hypothetical protein